MGMISRINEGIQCAVEKWPHVNLAVSLTGVTTAALSLCKLVTIVGGTIGAVCAAITGVYAVIDVIKKHRKK